MRVEFAEQYGVPCVVLDGSEEPEHVVDCCYESEAICVEDGEDCFVVQFPGRPQELYTRESLTRSLERRESTVS